MAWWRIATVQKKSAVEREFWVHSDKRWTVVRENGYRWGTILVETEDHNPPDIDLENAHGIDMYSTDYNYELDSLDDGCWADWEFPDDMPDEEREKVIEGFDEDSYDYMESNGWYNDETEVWFRGPLEMQRELNL